MTIPRIYFPRELKINSEIQLDEKASKHLLQVLRLQVEEKLILFNGINLTGEYLAKLVAIEKKLAHVVIEKFIAKHIESPLKIHLMQGIARGEKMDFIIQKAVELGVTSITPLFTEFCNVKLSEERWQNKLSHWQGVAESAAGQSGRIIVPKVLPMQNLASLQQISQNNCYLVLDPTAKDKINSLAPMIKNHSITIFIGPEGGFSESELSLFFKHNFHLVNLGPRILRTETAALVAISILQSCCGDL